jgi:hypothetical protein
MMTMDKPGKPIKVDAALYARLAALPERRAGTPRKDPTPEQWAAIEPWIGKRTIEDLAHANGVSENTFRRWMKERRR